MKLFFREYGEGTPLIILHGLYGSSDNWVTIALELSKDFRVILPDLRNHGRSDHHPTHDYMSMAKDIADLAKDLNIERFFLAGHSMGGKCALQFSRIWPEMILGLTIIDISPFKQKDNNNGAYLMHKNILNQLCKLNTHTLKSRDEADLILSSKIKSSKIRAFLLKNLSRDKQRNLVLKLNAQILLDNLDNILDGLTREKSANPSYGFPLIFIRALDSGYIPEDDIELIEQHYPAANIINIKDSSHWIHAEKPDIIIEILREQLL